MKILPAIVLLLCCGQALASDWYVPMGEGVQGGFDHIQIRMYYPYSFDSTAMSNFFGASLGSESWAQSFFNASAQVATADGPTTGSEKLYFDIWIAGDRNVDRPAFSFQTYRGNMIVDNADVICFGPGETDWMVAPGTWGIRKPMFDLLPGDANLDGSVTFADYQILEANFGDSPAVWGMGNFNGDQSVTFADYQILEANFGHSIPEPATIGMLLLGGLAMLRRRRA